MYTNIDDAKDDPLGTLLMNIPGVEAVEIENDVVITRVSDGYIIEEIIPKVQLAIEEHFQDDPSRY